MKVSFYSSVKETEVCSNLNLQEVLKDIAKGTWQDQVIRVRQSKTKEDKKWAKLKLPCFTTSGLFSIRKDDHITDHSGLIAMDFDDITTDQINSLRDDQYSFSGFISAGGYGFCTIVQITPSKHRESFEQLSDYYYNTYGISADPSCINESRVRYVSWDPNCYIKYNAKPFKCVPKTRQVKQPQLPTLLSTDDDFNDVLSQICSSGVEIGNSYHEWLRIGFAIESRFGERGRQYFHDISRISSKYNERVCDKQYDHCVKARGSGVSISTFFHYAKQAGITHDFTRSDKVFKEAAQQKRTHGDKDSTIRSLELQGITPTVAELEAIGQVFATPGAEGQVDKKPNKYKDARAYLNNNCDLWFESFSGRLFNGTTEMTDREINGLWEDMNQAEIHLRVGEVVQMCESKYTAEKHPIKDALEAYKELCADKEENFIHQFASAISCKNGVNKDQQTAHIDFCIRKFLLENIGKVYGKPYGISLLFLGPINTGKTSYARMLYSPDEIKPYFNQPNLIGTNDDNYHYTQNLCILLDENMPKAFQDYSNFKRISTQEYVSYRKAYARGIITRSVMSSFILTSNDFNFIPNEPNRRILPIEIDKQADWNVLNAIDIRLLWGQAMWMYENGYRAELTKQEVEYVDGMSGKYKLEDEVEGYIEQRFSSPKMSSDVVNGYNTTHVQLAIQKLSTRHIKLSEVAKALQNMGYSKMSETSTYWKIKEIGGLV